MSETSPWNLDNEILPGNLSTFSPNFLPVPISPSILKSPLHNSKHQFSALSYPISLDYSWTHFFPQGKNILIKNLQDLSIKHPYQYYTYILRPVAQQRTLFVLYHFWA